MCPLLLIQVQDIAGWKHTSRSPPSDRHRLAKGAIKGFNNTIMKVEVLFFGILAERAGTDRMFLEGIRDVKSLKSKIFLNYPDLERYSFRISVNKHLVEDAEKLRDGDEVALLPPFAGG